MTDEEKKAIEELKELLEKQNEKKIVTQNLFENITRVLLLIEKQDKRINELEKAVEKKDKIIDEMAKSIANYDIRLGTNYFQDEDHVKRFYKRYFEKEEGYK